MVSARRLQAGVHAALIALAIPYVWLNIGILMSTTERAPGSRLVYALLSVGWIIMAAIVIYMSKRDGADPLAFSWKDRVPLACAFIHGTISNLAMRQEMGLTASTIFSLACTALFGLIECIGTIVIDLLMWKSEDDEDDAAEGLVMDVGEEGALSLAAAASVQWPHFYNSSRLKVYRIAGVVSLVALAAATRESVGGDHMGGGRMGALGGVVLLLFMFASVALSLVVNGPKDGSGTNWYYRFSKRVLVASNVLAAFAMIGVRIVQRSAELADIGAVALVCLIPIAPLIAVARYDVAHPNEDAEDHSVQSIEEVEAVLFDPDAEEFQS